MHVYDSFLIAMREYIKEGAQQTIEMPPMPAGNPFALIDHLLAVEQRLRGGEALDAATEMHEPYWADIVRLLQVFWAREWAGENYANRLAELRSAFASALYRPYVDGERGAWELTWAPNETTRAARRNEDVAVQEC